MQAQDQAQSQEVSVRDVVMRIVTAHVKAQGYCLAREVRDQAAAAGAFLGLDLSLWDEATMNVVRHALESMLTADRKREMVATRRMMDDGQLVSVYEPAPAGSQEPAKRRHTRSWYHRHLLGLVTRVPDLYLGSVSRRALVRAIDGAFGYDGPPAVPAETQRQRA